ncbi:hypothetical protein JR316_0001569 [Psilocybe cubensis]|uniref:Uncharacterized protein n=2 Tax=Psilocybe cubensis TaxID=181762 RepID=A0ACB8HBY8_PSICU|nr:hypothetical protein JR316_0001569 [Psilocybe cubensis]KAH9484670.1 hypothetical protein JR316_0001569 [Psilocybe cubensis]
MPLPGANPAQKTNFIIRAPPKRSEKVNVTRVYGATASQVVAFHPQFDVADQLLVWYAVDCMTDGFGRVAPPT